MFYPISKETIVDRHFQDPAEKIASELSVQVLPEPVGDPGYWRDMIEIAGLVLDTNPVTVNIPDRATRLDIILFDSVITDAEITAEDESGRSVKVAAHGSSASGSSYLLINPMIPLSSQNQQRFLTGRTINLRSDKPHRVFLEWI